MTAPSVSSAGLLPKKICTFRILLLALLLSSSRHALAKNTGITRTTACGIPLLILKVDLQDPDVKVTGMMAQGGNGHSESFESMIHRTHPTAAFTGTFFCPHSLIPVGDLVVDGHLQHRGGVGTGFCLTDDNQCDFIQPGHRYQRVDWSAYDFVVCAGPRLVHDGDASIHPASEGFHDSHLLGTAIRLAVGLTANNKLLFVATRQPVQLGRLAKAMKKLGCTDAINLDAGSSLGFYDNAKTYMHPQRKLTNLILIYDDKSRYEKFKYRLTPETHVAKK